MRTSKVFKRALYSCRKTSTWRKLVQVQTFLSAGILNFHHKVLYQLLMKRVLRLIHAYVSRFYGLGLKKCGVKQ